MYKNLLLVVFFCVFTSLPFFSVNLSADHIRGFSSGVYGDRFNYRDYGNRNRDYYFYDGGSPYYYYNYGYPYYDNYYNNSPYYDSGVGVGLGGTGTGVYFNW